MIYQPFNIIFKTFDTSFDLAYFVGAVFITGYAFIFVSVFLGLTGDEMVRIGLAALLVVSLYAVWDEWRQA